MDAHKGTTELPVGSATNKGRPRVISQSQSSPTKRTSSLESSEDSITSACTRKTLKKERKLAKKARREERRRLKEEKRLEKELKKEEKRRRKALKKRGRNERADKHESSTNQQRDEVADVASKPIKKRKINEIKSRNENSIDSCNARGSSVASTGSNENDDQVSVDDGSDPGSQDDSSAHEVACDSNNDRSESYNATNDDAKESNEDVATNEDTAPKKRKHKEGVRKGRSQWSISNRHSPRTWNERLEALINFKLEHGHTNVPSRNFHDRGLAEFVVQIRNKPGELNREQKDKLRDLGFDWTTEKEKLEKAWEENLDRLENFYKRHKNFALHKFPDFKKLHGWLSWQRTLQRDGRLRDDRKERLEGIGFKDWTLKRKKKNEETIPNSWMRQYKNLRVYVTENGHAMVPQHKHTDDHDNRTLANWVLKQRALRKNGLLSAKKIALLEELDFVWTFDGSNAPLRSGKLCDQRKEFDISYDHLRQYKEENGTIEDVRGDMMIGDRNVGKWLANQKSLCRRGRLSDDRKDRLEELGATF
ncbi:MAG: hypothetical protein SGBAC_001534 [Bacillariaceae sp.]